MPLFNELTDKHGRMLDPEERKAEDLKRTNKKFKRGGTSLRSKSISYTTVKRTLNVITIIGVLAIITALIGGALWLMSIFMHPEPAAIDHGVQPNVAPAVQEAPRRAAPSR